MFLRYCRLRFALIAYLVIAGPSGAAIVFNDGFDDGSFSDGSPVTWVPAPVLPAYYDASTGDFRMESTGSSLDFVAAAVPSILLANTSIRTQTRIGLDGESVFVTARNQDQSEFNNYFGGVTANGSSADVFFGRTDANTTTFFQEETISLPLDATANDFLMQLDVVGTTISFRVWLPGEPIPIEPLYTHQDTVYVSGFIQIGGTATPGAAYDFRRVTVGDTPLGDPTAPLVLRVNTTTGGVTLEGVGPESIETVSYLIDSPSGSLNPIGWLDGGLDAQGVGAGTGAGESWEVVNASPNQLLEAYLLGSSAFGPGETVSLGLAYDFMKDARDLTFQVATSGDEVLPGAIDYYQAPAVAGDFDLDSDVDNSDYQAWRRSYGRLGVTGADGNADGVVDAADYTVWRDAMSADALAAPEPNSAALIGVLATGSLFLVRSAGR